MLPLSAAAHEMRPSLVDLQADAAGRVAVVWKVGFASGQPMPLRLMLPAHCSPIGSPSADLSATVRTERWAVRCAEGLADAAITVDGLDATGTDVLLRFRAADGVVHQAVLRPGAATWRVPGPGAVPEGTGAAGYFAIGVEHILLGPDHLLFVVALLLVIWGRWRTLLGTLTAFTLAHSVTLAISVLGWFRPPGASVEAIIAGSILLLAVELASDRPTTLTWRRPWLVAGVCGLIHGFGFAGALGEIGLPAGEVPLALLLFNLGVEAGQVAFVGVLVAGAWAFRRLPTRAAAPLLRAATVWSIGVVAAWWTLDRCLLVIG